MVLDIINGLMDQNIMENGLIIRLKDREYIPGLMDEDMMVNGKKIICMVTVFTLGPTEEGTKVNIKRTRNTDTARLPGLMREYTLDGGKMANNMVKAYTQTGKAKPVKESGMRVAESNGWTRAENEISNFVRI